VKSSRVKSTEPVMMKSYQTWTIGNSARANAGKGGRHIVFLRPQQSVGVDTYPLVRSEFVVTKKLRRVLT